MTYRIDHLKGACSCGFNYNLSTLNDMILTGTASDAVGNKNTRNNIFMLIKYRVKSEMCL